MAINIYLRGKLKDQYLASYQPYGKIGILGLNMSQYSRSIHHPDHFPSSPLPPNTIMFFKRATSINQISYFTVKIRYYRYAHATLFETPILVDHNIPLPRLLSKTYLQRMLDKVIIFLSIEIYYYAGHYIRIKL